MLPSTSETGCSFFQSRTPGKPSKNTRRGFDAAHRHRMSETVTSEEIRRVMALMGQRGGSKKSAAKAEAARRNGKRGGRPKRKTADLCAA